MTSINFDDEQLGSMELYGLRLQKVVDDFTEFDAITKAYVDTQVAQAKQQLTNGASDALDTFKELEDYLTNSGTAGGLVDQIAALSAQITAEANRAGTAEGSLDTRVTALENDTTSATGISTVQSELDATQHGAGLDLDGAYVAEAGRNYISSATSLKSADALMDSALKTEVDRATAAEQGLASSLATAANERVSIDTAYKVADEAIRDRLVILENDPTTQTEVNIVGNLVNVLTDNVNSGLAGILGTASVDRASRIDGDNALSDRLETLEADPTTATAVAGVATSVAELETSVNADFDAMQASLDTVESDYKQADTEIKQATLGNRQSTWEDGTLKYHYQDVNYPPLQDGSVADHLYQVDSQVLKHNNLIGSTDNDDRLSFTPAFNPPAYLRVDQEQKTTIAEDVVQALQNIAVHTKDADDALTTRIADQESKQTTDDTFAATDRANIRTELEQEVGEERVRAEGFEQGLRTDIDAQVAKQAQDKTETDEAIQAEATARAATDTLLNSAIATNTVNIEAQISKQAQDKTEADERHTASEAKHTTSDTRHDEHDARHTASEEKHTTSDGRHTSHEQNLAELETEKFDKVGGTITGEVRVNLDASYFYLSSVWRIRTDSVGKRIVFEFNKDTAANEGEGDWVSGIPFISSH
jgi:hypothetical protein